MMKLNTRTRILIVALVGLLATFSSRAYAGPANNCKSDRRLDAAMQFAVDVQSAARVHVSAYGGSDRTNYVVPYYWRVYNSQGRQVDSFPRTPLVFVSPNMLRETNIEGLLPGESYTFELTSRDSCNNLGVVRKAITMPSLSAESNAPEVTNPAIVMVGILGAESRRVQFAATDETGVQEITMLINGTVVSNQKYGVTFRWWCDDYPDDEVLSGFEAPNYYLAYPNSYAGTYSLVEVVVVDVAGNTTTLSAMLFL
jgi:hypothetical protein